MAEAPQVSRCTAPYFAKHAGCLQGDHSVMTTSSESDCYAERMQNSRGIEILRLPFNWATGQATASPTVYYILTGVADTRSIAKEGSTIHCLEKDHRARQSACESSVQRKTRCSEARSHPRQTDTPTRTSSPRIHKLPARTAFPQDFRPSSCTRTCERVPSPNPAVQKTATSLPQWHDPPNH